MPQGSALAPTLFNIMISIFPNISGVYRTEHAYDLAIYITGDTMLNLTDPLQRQITLIEEWSNKWGSEVTIERTKGTCFTSKRNIVHDLNYGSIESVQSYKFFLCLF